MKKNLYLIIIAGLLSSCYYDNEQDLYPASPQNNPPTNTDSVVSFSKTIQPIIANNCATSGCHVANFTAPNLTTHASIAANKERIKIRAIDGKPTPMPATGLMSVDNRTKLAAWIEAGAPNN
jgi:uncharacterized membrane protein